MRENYTLQQDFTFAEYLRATAYISVRIKIVKRIFFFGIAISILSILLNRLLMEKPAGHWYQPVLEFMLVPLFMLCFFAIGIIILGAIIYFSMRQHFKDIIFHFNHWGIEKKENGVDFNTPWRKVLRMKENNEFLFLYTGENAAVVLQKRLFADKTELEEFKEFVVSKLN